MTITVNYWGLTGTLNSVSIDETTATIDDLITAIAADEGLPTVYYAISLLDDPSINDVVFGDSATTLDDPSMDIQDGDTFLCTTNQYGTKEERQIQKLEIAAVKRNDTYDITQLPTQYSGNNVVDNPNVGGLVSKRPWNTP